MRRRMSLTLTAATAAITFALAGCASSYDKPMPPGADAEAIAEKESNDDLTEVTVGVLPIVDVAPIYLGVEEGVFAKHGIDLTIDKAANGKEIIDNVMAGAWDFGFSNVTSIVIEGTKSQNLKIVAAGNFSSGDTGADFGAMVAAPGSGIETAEDLGGDDILIGVNAPNGINQSMVQKFAADAGVVLHPKDNFSAMGFDKMPDALGTGNGQLDAAFLVEPHLSRAKAAGATEIPGTSYASVNPDLMIAAYFTANDTVILEPQIVENFTAAMNESLELASANPNGARDILETYTTIPPEVENKMVLPRWHSDVSEESATLLAGLATQFLGAKDLDPSVVFLEPTS